MVHIIYLHKKHFYVTKNKIAAKCSSKWTRRMHIYLLLISAYSSEMTPKNVNVNMLQKEIICRVNKVCRKFGLKTLEGRKYWIYSMLNIVNAYNINKM